MQIVDGETHHPSLEDESFFIVIVHSSQAKAT